jgi:four helix bundle protein
MGLPLRRGAGPLRDQLHRASLSVVLNIAEGAGRNARADKRHFYEIAKGSAAETAAALEVARLRRLAPEGGLRQARGLAVRVATILTRLSGPLR